MDANYYRARIQNALEFIEQHLTQRFSAEDVAHAAAFSEYHFHRLFPALMGEPIHQYVRSRRLEKAATLLTENPQMRLLDLALEVGFETHSAFTRAFRQHFGVSPSQFKAQPWSNVIHASRPFLKAAAVEPLTLQHAVQHLPQLFLIYKVTHGTSSGKFFAQQDVGHEFAMLAQHNRDGLYGLVSAFPASPKSLNDLMAEVWYGGLFTTQTQCTWSQQYLCIAAGNWAVFDYQGSYDYLHQVWNQIYYAWLPNSGYTLRHTLPFEMYLNDPQQVEAAALLTQIWLPIT